MAMINGKEYKNTDIKLMIGGVEVETTGIVYGDENQTLDNAKIKAFSAIPIEISIDDKDLEHLKVFANTGEMKPLSFTSEGMIKLLTELGLEDRANEIEPDSIYTLTH